MALLLRLRLLLLEEEGGCVQRGAGFGCGCARPHRGERAPPEQAELACAAGHMRDLLVWLFWSDSFE